jgi:hypothetical protein
MFLEHSDPLKEEGRVIIQLMALRVYQPKVYCALLAMSNGVRVRAMSVVP